MDKRPTAKEALSHPWFIDPETPVLSSNNLTLVIDNMKLYQQEYTNVILKFINKFYSRFNMTKINPLSAN